MAPVFSPGRPRKIVTGKMPGTCRIFFCGKGRLIGHVLESEVNELYFNGFLF
jgi:hypothetical protein